MQYITVDPNEPVECHGEKLTFHDQKCIEQNSNWRLIVLDDGEVYQAHDNECSEEEDVLWLKLSDDTIRTLDEEGYIDLGDAEIQADESHFLFHENLFEVFKKCKKSDVSDMYPGLSYGSSIDYSI